MINFREKNLLLISLLSIFLTIISLSAIYYEDRALMSGEISSFFDPEGDLLIGTYYPGKIEAGIIILEGFGSDQIAMKGIANEFAKLNFHVFTFDFSAHGRSPGKLGFDNAATDRLAFQVLAAKEKFKNLSGLNDSQILLMGHSMGARVALQSTVYDPFNVSGLILVGTSINLGTNVQSTFFTGVNDNDLTWIQGLNATNPSVDLILLSGSLDDIITPDSANLLYQKLGGGSSPYGREMVIFDLLLHNYEIYSSELISYALNWGVEILNLESDPNYIASGVFLRNILWLLSITGLFIFTIFGAMYFKKRNNAENEPIDQDGEVKITSIKKFLLGKMILWLAAIPILILLFIIFVFIPLGVPIFNLIYVGFICSYGILLYILYKKRKLPGTDGSFKIRIKINRNKDSLFGIITILLLLSISTFFANSGIYYVFPLNERLIWLIILTLFTIPGFLITRKEATYIKGSFKEKNKYNLYSSLIGFIPFFLLIIFYLTIGSLSGMIGTFHGIIILALALTGGSLIQQVGRSDLLTIIFQSFLIQYLILPTGVLFAIF